MSFQKTSTELALARRIVDAIFEAVKKGGRPIAVAVVDENSEPVYTARMDGTSTTDVRMAARKAYTAAFIGRDSSLWHGQITSDGRTVADWADPMLTSLHGGWTLRRNSQVIGGIGVSGTGDENHDERLALVGAELGAKHAIAQRDAAENHVHTALQGADTTDRPYQKTRTSKRTVFNLPGLSPEGSAAPDLVKVGDMFFTSGVRGVDLKTGDIGATPKEEFLLAWRNLKALVEGAGLSTDDIGLVTNFLDSQDYRPFINTGWLELFPDENNRPARKTTAYPLAPGEGVELQAFGVVGEKRQRIEVPGLTHRDPLPNGVRMGDYVFSSVIVPWDLSTSEPVLGEENQTDQCFANMQTFMQAAGGSVDDVALQWIYLNDFGYQPYMVEVYLESWPGGRFQAARKTYRYAMGAQAQIQVIGKVGQSDRGDYEIPGVEHHDPIPMGARIDNLLCTSGIHGVDPTSDDPLGVVDGVGPQTMWCLSHVKRMTEAAGLSADDIGHLTLLVQDYADVPAIDAEFIKAFPNPADRPARQIMKLGIARDTRVQFHVIANA
jgi:2-iminobutanoate/2-iminopropanoate deaminase